MENNNVMETMSHSTASVASVASVASASTVMASVSTFKSAIVRVRDILRVCGITGMDSMRHICLYLLARYMTRANISEFKIPDKLSWDNIIDTLRTKEGGRTLVFEWFWHPASPEGACLLHHVDRLFGTDKFSFDLKSAPKHAEILEILDAVDMKAVDVQMDVLGYVYEQHLKTGSSAARDLGQFFTDRSICDYMVSLCAPKFKHPGVPETVVDPTMGTAGMLTAYVKYFYNTYPDQPIDWRVHQHVLQGCDTDVRVAAVARINLFMELGGHCATHLETRNSLYQDLPQMGYDVILANMPFGLKGITHAECCERVKSLKIRGTKSEPLFLQLMMVSLNPGGRCAVVVPDGMLVNQSACHDGTRRYLLDHFEVRRVIKMRGKFFMNTGIQPSILFFENTGRPTQAVEFWDVERLEDGTVKETMMISVARDRFDGACSLDVRRYMEVKEVTNTTGWPMVKLGEIAFGKKYPSHDTSVGKESGSSRFHTGGEYTRLYTDNPDIHDTIIIVNRTNGSGKSNIFIDSNCSVAKQTLVMSCNDIITTKYVFYWLSLNKHAIEKGYIGSNHKNLSNDFVKNMLMPLPPLPVQAEIVATLDRIYAPGTTDLADTLRLTTQAMDLVLAQPNGSTLEPIVEAQRLARKSAQMVADVRAQMVADVRAQMVAIMRSVGRRGFPVVKLGELFNAPSIKHRYTNKDVSANGIPFYNGCYDSPKGFITTLHPSYTSPDEYLIIIKDGGGDHTSFTVGLGKTFIVTGSVCIASQNVVLVPKIALNLKFIYYVLSLRVKELRDLSKKSINLEHLSIHDLLAFPVAIPPLDFQTAVVARLDALQAQVAALESLQQHSEDNARFILESYLSASSSPCTPSTPLESHSSTCHIQEDGTGCTCRVLTPSVPSASVGFSAEDEVAEELPMITTESSSASTASTSLSQDYTTMSNTALIALCKERKIRGYSGKKKEELVALLRRSS